MSAAQFQGLLSARGIPTELSSSEITCAVVPVLLFVARSTHSHFLCRNVSTAFSAADGVVDVLAFLRAIEACIRRQSAPVYTGSDAEVMGAIGSKLLSHVNFAVEAGEMRALEDELRRREEEGYVSVVHFLAALDVGHVVMSESDLARLCGM